MKGISFCAVLLACLPGIAPAYCGGYGAVHYSPYALNYYGSGLVPCGAEYTPYALNYYGSALVPGYGICNYDTSDYYPLLSVPLGAVRHGVSHVSHVVSHRVQDVPRPMRPPVCPGPWHKDPMDVIRQHLRQRGFGSVSCNHICRMDNDLVGAEFRVNDRHLLIKYCDPEQVRRMSTGEACKQKAYAQYQQEWERSAEQFRQTGGVIFMVSVAEPEAIVAALDSCPTLVPGGSAPTLYAKE